MRIATVLSCIAIVATTGCAVPVASNTSVVVDCSVSRAQSRSGPALVGLSYGMDMTPIPLNSVQFGSRAAARSLAVQGLFAQRSASDTVQVTARFVSCVDTASAIRVRTAFLRTNNAPSEPTSAWRTVHLQPRATAIYTESSISRDVASYLIEVAGD